jgi:ATP-binding cassette subfamily B protein
VNTLVADSDPTDLGSWRDRLRTLILAVRIVFSAGPALMFGILIATLLTSVAIALQLLVGRSILDLLATRDRVDIGDLGPYLAALAGLMLMSALSQSMAGELRIPLGERVARHTMDEIFDVATEVELESYDSADFHDRLQRAAGAAGGRSSAVVFGLVTIGSTVVVAAGVVLVLLTVAPILVPFSVLGYIPVAFVHVRNNRAMYELEFELTELMRERSYLEFLLTDRSEAKELRSYELAPTFRRWHATQWDTRLRLLKDLIRRRLTLTTAASAVSTAVLVGTLSFALILAGRGSISLGDAAVAIVGLQQLGGRLQSAGNAFAGVHSGVTFLRDFEGFQASLPTIRAARPRGEPPADPSTISALDLGYRYPGAQVDALQSIEFELQTGQTMAIVGANGSGKSTLAKLLCGLLPPSTGSVRWDDVDLATCDPALVRARIAPVFQDYSRYFMTIRQAIALGDMSSIDDDDRLRHVATLAGLDELIDSRPSGLDTRLGKAFAEGVDVSIGQWQRIAIARALVRDAPILVLDEPSASLDPRAEAELFDLLHSLGDGRTVIFISHRFATARAADQIMVLDHGEIVELGGHDALMTEGGLYAELFALQASRYGM